MDVSDLCKKCGFCCDGTLFEKARTHNKDTKAFLTLDKFELIEGGKFFKQPCSYFNECCSVYDKEKPTICGKFYCQQIFKLRSSEITFEEVESNIYKLHACKNQLKDVTQKYYPHLAKYSVSALNNFLIENENKFGVFQSRKDYVHIYLVIQKVNELGKLFKLEST